MSDKILEIRAPEQRLVDDQNRGGSVTGQRAVPILRKFDRVGGVQHDRVDGSALQGVGQGRGRDRMQLHRAPQVGENGLPLEVPPIHVSPVSYTHLTLPTNSRV